MAEEQRFKSQAESFEIGKWDEDVWSDMGEMWRKMPVQKERHPVQPQEKNRAGEGRDGAGRANALEGVSALLWDDKIPRRDPRKLYLNMHPRAEPRHAVPGRQCQEQGGPGWGHSRPWVLKRVGQRAEQQSWKGLNTHVLAMKPSQTPRIGATV